MTSFVRSRRSWAFGLAIAEFSSLNRPVLVYGDRARVPEQAHLDQLGDRALPYTDAASLRRLLVELVPMPDRDWNAFADFGPAAVMGRFRDVFLG